MTAKEKHNLYMREYRKRNRKRTSKIERQSRSRNPELYAEMNRKAARRERQTHKLERQARKTLAYAVKSGNLVRPASCSVCGDACKPDGHHPGYTKPLNVIWLCKALSQKITMRSPRTCCGRWCIILAFELYEKDRRTTHVRSSLRDLDYCPWHHPRRDGRWRC